ncbi:MAG: hypothetical protein LBB81_08800 [Treponema sp.]|jgi:hypothetical protein|nr:hypothetical protein [Treponema sp.]
MRKPLASRIIGLTATYCAVFVILVILQFSKNGNFTLSAGAMTIRGNYRNAVEDAKADEKNLLGGVTVFYGGLEFSLKDRGKALTIRDNDSNITPINPGSLLLKDDDAVFTLPGGTRLFFLSSDSIRGSELQITATFADNISEVSIPIFPRHSSPARDNGQSGISYNGTWYSFARRGNELEYGKIILTKENNICVYRSGGKQRIFEPADFMLAASQTADEYEAAVSNWRNLNFANWNQNPVLLRTEDDVTAYCGESLFHARYSAAVSSVPAEFINSPFHGYYSSAYIGGVSQANRKFTAAEREKIDLLTRLINTGSPAVLLQEHVIDFLLTRSLTALAGDFSGILREIKPEDISPEQCRGVFEVYSDFKRWRLNGTNPAEHLINQALTLLPEYLNRDIGMDLVYVSFSETIDYVNSLKIGKALAEWAVSADNSEWAAIGRSLVLSALDSGISAGQLYCALSPHNYAPKALSLGINNIWAWTVSSSASASYQDGNLNILFNFPENMSHYVIIRGIRPFLKIQIHNIDFRSDAQFERYDSSGWIYYTQDNILVLKLKHRGTVENVKVFYRIEAPPEPVENTRPASEDYVENTDQ